MQFHDHSPIFMQIVELMQNYIIRNEWIEGERIPSVRALASELEVNPNTCMRAYAHLQDQGMIFNKRGVGYFVADNAQSSILAEQKAQFLEQTLPEIVKQAKLLGLTDEEWGEVW